MHVLIATLIFLFHPACQCGVRDAARTVTPVPPPDGYAESWKKGKRKIREQSFRVSVSRQNPRFEADVIDAKGKRRYVLRMVPLSSDPEQGAWSLELHRKSWWFNAATPKWRWNHLRPESEPNDDEASAEDFVNFFTGQCNPPHSTSWGGTPGTALLARRIYKVEGFYVVFQVVSYTIRPGTDGLLADLQIDVRFTNDRPSMPAPIPHTP